MTSRDLVNRAIAHETTERIPHCIGLTQELGNTLKGKHGVTDGDEFLQNDVIRLFPPFWRWKDLAPSFYESELPTARRTLRGTGSYEEFFAAAERRHAEGKYVLACFYGSFFEQAQWGRGMANLLADMLGDPEATHALLNDMIRRNLVMIENILQCPQVDGVLLGSDWGTQVDLIMSPATWREFIRPYEQQEYDLIKSYGKHVWIHSCGNIVKIIPDLIEMGIDVLNPVQPECMDIAMLKREFGERLTFWGGLSTQRTLPYGTPDEVRREAAEVRSILGKNGGYIFAPAQELQDDVPLANIEALREMCQTN